ncbi:MAG: hypothetical protein M3Z07_03270 [Candidatus Eremiobacteraeota bacterium]|nr:hypothetical protein [Candidatus Eremiobacteraeota bacterium]MDQ6931062.1 hypothetical protein [Candidatus Eremiobacteraeota bacterium]
MPENDNDGDAVVGDRFGDDDGFYTIGNGEFAEDRDYCDRVSRGGHRAVQQRGTDRQERQRRDSGGDRERDDERPGKS